MLPCQHQSTYHHETITLSFLFIPKTLLIWISQYKTNSNFQKFHRLLNFFTLKMQSLSKFKPLCNIHYRAPVKRPNLTPRGKTMSALALEGELKCSPVKLAVRGAGLRVFSAPSALQGPQNTSHRLRLAPLRSCCCPWWSSHGIVISKMLGLLQLGCTFTNSLSGLSSWCQASASLHDPFNPRPSNATEALSMASRGLSQC